MIQPLWTEPPLRDGLIEKRKQPRGRIAAEAATRDGDVALPQQA
jgi:hypothetical protein